MTELSTNVVNSSGQTTPETQAVTVPITRERAKQTTPHDEFWRKEKRKNTGIIERIYNKIKNVTGLGIGSKKVETALSDVKNGKISANKFKQTVKDYNSSQETSAQAFGDLLSVGAAGLTYFGLRNEAKLHHSGKVLNEKFGSKNAWIEAAETAGGGFNWKTLKKGISRILAHMAGSKTKLAIFTTGMAAAVGGGVKMHAMQLNRIGSQEFKADKRDFNNLSNEYDRAAYKGKKRMKQAMILFNIQRLFVL